MSQRGMNGAQRNGNKGNQRQRDKTKMAARNPIVQFEQQYRETSDYYYRLKQQNVVHRISKRL